MTVRAVRLSDGQHLDCHPGVLRPRRYPTRAARPQPTGVCVHNVVLPGDRRAHVHARASEDLRPVLRRVLRRFADTRRLEGAATCGAPWRQRPEGGCVGMARLFAAYGALMTASLSRLGF